MDLGLNHSPIALLQLNHRVLAVAGERGVGKTTSTIGQSASFKIFESQESVRGAEEGGAKMQARLVKVVVSTCPRVKRQVCGGHEGGGGGGQSSRLFQGTFGRMQPTCNMRVDERGVRSLAFWHRRTLFVGCMIERRRVDELHVYFV